MRASIGAVALMHLCVASAAAQSNDSLIGEALASLTNTPGGCSGDLRRVDTSIAFFPRVRFIRGYCTVEHGDPTSAVVAIDRSDVLYLLSSTDAFNFLVKRHPPIGLDSLTAVIYARLALEFTGHANGHSKVVTSMRDIPGGARERLDVGRGRTVYIHSNSPRHGWEVAFGTVEPGYDRSHYKRNHVSISGGGHVFLARDSLVFPDPPVH